MNLHIDIEPQKEYKPGYPIEKRGIYYLARELSSQLSLVTEDTNYSSLSKCYSIFICRDGVPKDEQFSISVIEMSNTRNYGKCHPEKKNYDLLTLVIIRLGNQIFREMEIDEKDSEELNTFLLKDDKLKKLDVEAARVIKACTNTDIHIDEGKEVVNVCKAVQDMNEKARREGRQEARLETLSDSVKNVMESLKMSVEEAMKVLKIKEEDRATLMKMI